MPVSVYFNNQGATREQILVEDLIIESIRNHGIDIYFIPRTSQDIFDSLFGDDPVKYFERAYKIDMYMETFNDFEGQQEFFSKFGLNIDKTARVAVARRTFERFVPTSVRAFPKEGDLIFLPIQQKLMEIRFVEEEKNFFQLGKLQPYMFGLSLETFRYNGEFLNTGIEEIDFIADNVAVSTSFSVNAVNEASTFSRGEVVYQGASLALATSVGIVASFDKVEGVLRLRHIKGDFHSDDPIFGVSGGGHYNIIPSASHDERDNASDGYDDNSYIESQANNILDFTETNPFGEP